MSVPPKCFLPHALMWPLLSPLFIMDSVCLPPIHPFHLPKGLTFPTLKKHESLTVAIIHNCSSEVSWAPNKQTNQKTRIYHILFRSESGFLEVRPGLFLISGSWWVSAKHTCEHGQKWGAGRNSIHIYIFNLFIIYLMLKRFMASNKYLKYAIALELCNE